MSPIQPKDKSLQVKGSQLQPCMGQTSPIPLTGFQWPRPLSCLGEWEAGMRDRHSLCPPPHTRPLQITLGAKTRQGFCIPIPTTAGSGTERWDAWLSRCQTSPCLAARRLCRAGLVVPNPLRSSLSWLSLPRRKH